MGICPAYRPSLIEPSYADVMRAVEARPDLTAGQRRQQLCSLNVIGGMLSPDLEVLPGRWTAIKGRALRLQPAQRGIAPKTLKNHIASVRGSLTWFSDEHDLPKRGVPLSPEWETLRSRIKDVRTRLLLSASMRFWSARGSSPNAIDEQAVDAYMAYRAATTALAAGPAARRGVARAWNKCVGTIKGWPPQILWEPPCRSGSKGPAWDRFPQTLPTDIEAWLASLTKIRKTPGGKRWRPCKPTTIDMRRARLKAFARKAVSIGVPIESLTSLRALLAPDLVERVLDAYWPDEGEEPKGYVIDLARQIVSCARTIDGFDPASLERLEDMWFELEAYQTWDMTEKNLALVRQVLVPGIWRRVVALPAELMLEARKNRSQSPIKAAVQAQMACAIAILLVAPVRLGNLASIKLDTHLLRPGGTDAPYWLHFPRYDVKNRVRLEFPLDERVTALVEEYVNDFLPTLRRGSNEPYLFPGETGGHKGKATLSAQISQRILKATGLRVTVHQFRHAAAALFLQQHPGCYERVRQLLGHKTLATTTKFYIALQTTGPGEMLADIVWSHLEFKSEAA